MPTGTMCNQIALRLHIRPGGDEVILATGASHPVNFEAGGPAQLAGAMIRDARGRGRDVHGGAVVEAASAPRTRHKPRSRLVCVEQTTNLGGGRVWPLPAIEGVLGSRASTGW